MSKTMIMLIEESYLHILSIGPFIMITGYFFNLMSTEIVIVEKPVFIEDYEDIAKQSLILLFRKTLTDYEHLRDADEGCRFLFKEFIL